MRLSLRFVLPALLLALPACYDLTVTDPNAPDHTALWSNVDQLESQTADAFKAWFEANYAYSSVGLQLSVASFEHSSPWAGGGYTPFNELPRTSIGLESVFSNKKWYPWYHLYEGYTTALDGLQALQDSAVRNGLGPGRAARLEAFSRFVEGLTLGSLALLYDRAAIPSEADYPYGENPPLVGYDSVMSVALADLEEAAGLSQGADWPDIPADWMSVAVTPDELARLAHSFAARFRANVARTPAERAAVDWAQVMADVDAGITTSWVMDMDVHKGFYNEVIDYGTYPGWAMETYFVLGLADQSGNYQRWLGLPVADRQPAPDTNGDGKGDPVLIVTPDTRFPRGSTMLEQESNPGTLYAIPCEAGADAPAACAESDWNIQNMWAHPERGTWRWSYYWHTDTYPYSTWTDFHWPEITLAEMRLLKAEGLMRQGDAAGAAALVNVSRTANGLAATDAGGANTDCVPRMPDGRCGDLMEMLKWEKRLETHYAGPFGAGWYFDGRGWGDLYRGTFLELPIPCDELKIMNKSPCYTFGGVDGDMASPGSVYAWPGES
jgi:hypothetical protein